MTTSNIISVLSLIISVLTFLLTIISGLVKAYRASLRIKMFVKQDESFFLDAIWSETNSPCSLVATVRIVNKSTVPFTISSIDLLVNNRYLPSVQTLPCAYPEYWRSPRGRIRKSKNGNLEIWCRDGEGEHIIDIDNSYIKYPQTLVPFDEISGVLLFAAAEDAPGETQNAQIRIKTSRGVKLFTFKINTRNTVRNSFT